MGNLRVTNDVMVMRKWVKRRADIQEPVWWNHDVLVPIRIYECLLCGVLKKGHQNMYDHLAVSHRKRLSNNHYKALKLMKETKDDKRVGEGVRVEAVGTNVRR